MMFTVLFTLMAPVVRSDAPVTERVLTEIKNQTTGHLTETAESRRRIDGRFVKVGGRHCTWIHTRNAAISGHNRLYLKNAKYTVSKCKAECQKRNWCVSIDYHKNTNTCDLSDKSAPDVPLQTVYRGDPFDHYALYCSESAYKAYYGVDISGTDISCGKYKTETALRQACDRNRQCIGYSIYLGKPWCMKKAGSYMTPQRDHTFYLKMRQPPPPTPRPTPRPKPAKCTGWSSNKESFIGNHYNCMGGTKSLFGKRTTSSAKCEALCLGMAKKKKATGCCERSLEKNGACEFYIAGVKGPTVTAKKTQITMCNG